MKEMLIVRQTWCSGIWVCENMYTINQFKVNDDILYSILMLLFNVQAKEKGQSLFSRTASAMTYYKIINHQLSLISLSIIIMILLYAKNNPRRWRRWWKKFIISKRCTSQNITINVWVFFDIRSLFLLHIIRLYSFIHFLFVRLYFLQIFSPSVMNRNQWARYRFSFGIPRLYNFSFHYAIFTWIVIICIYESMHQFFCLFLLHFVHLDPHPNSPSLSDSLYSFVVAFFSFRLLDICHFLCHYYC